MVEWVREGKVRGNIKQRSSCSVKPAPPPPPIAKGKTFTYADIEAARMQAFVAGMVAAESDLVLEEIRRIAGQFNELLKSAGK